MIVELFPELREGSLSGEPHDGGAVVDSAQVNIFSNITTIVLFTVYTPDITADDQVNLSDLTEVLLQWGDCPDGLFEPCPADTNGDGAVDLGDLTNVLLNWS